MLATITPKITTTTISAKKTKDKIANITDRLQFSEIWSMMLPDTLKMVANHFQYEMELMLEAMNMHPMCMSEFKHLDSIRNSSSSELDILILASRALVCLIHIWLHHICFNSG